MEKQLVYLDYAATTPVREEVLADINELWQKKYGNPSSVHSLGREAKNILATARTKIAACINAATSEIFFTSGGTEADNWAIKGVAKANAYKGKHIVVSSIEHQAVLKAAKALSKDGFKITYLPVDKSGVVKLDTLKKAVQKDTILVSIMTANNEIGTIQPVAEIGAWCRKQEIIFHTDAVQAAGLLPIDVEEQNIDLCSLSGHKLYAPKGCGCLYIRRGIKIGNLLDGGGQERTKRGGTENLPAIVGMATGLALAVREQKAETERLRELQTLLIDAITLALPDTIVAGASTERLANNINFIFPNIDGEAMLLMLDSFGYCCSAGSACTAGSLEASHVLLAMGYSPELASNSLRISLGRYTTRAEIDDFIVVLKGVVKRLQQVKMF